LLLALKFKENDILVGKITPKGRNRTNSRRKIVRSIFTEKARDIKDTSLRLEHGKKGRVVGVKIFLKRSRT
jgi:DNA-directed RNA polymerase subunit beta